MYIINNLSQACISNVIQAYSSLTCPHWCGLLCNGIRYKQQPALLISEFSLRFIIWHLYECEISWTDGQNKIFVKQEGSTRMGGKGIASPPAKNRNKLLQKNGVLFQSSIPDSGPRRGDSKWVKSQFSIEVLVCTFKFFSGNSIDIWLQPKRANGCRQVSKLLLELLNLSLTLQGSLHFY